MEPVGAIGSGKPWRRRRQRRRVRPPALLAVRASGRPSVHPGVRPFIRASGRPSGRTPAVAVCILAARGPGGGRSCGLRALRGERMHDALRPPLRLLLARPLLHKPSIFTGGGDLKSAMNVDRCRSHARCLQNKRGNAIGARWGWELGLGKGPKQGAETSSVAPDWRCSSAAN